MGDNVKRRGQALRGGRVVRSVELREEGWQGGAEVDENKIDEKVGEGVGGGGGGFSGAGGGCILIREEKGGCLEGVQFEEGG